MLEIKIFEGKTTTEAIEKGLKELKLSKEQVEIKVLENEDKRSFFSILTPRIVKVQIIPKTNKNVERPKKEHKVILENIDFNKATQNVEKFLNSWIKTIPSEDVKYTTKVEEGYLKIDIEGNDLNYLIGHRGEVLNQLHYLCYSALKEGLLRH